MDHLLPEIRGDQKSTKLDNKTRADLALVSHQFHNVIQPRLGRALRIESEVEATRWLGFSEGERKSETLGSRLRHHMNHLMGQDKQKLVPIQRQPWRVVLPSVNIL